MKIKFINKSIIEKLVQNKIVNSVIEFINI